MHCLEKKDFSLMRIVQMFETKSPSPSGNRVTLACAAAHQLEVLLGYLEMLPRAVLLAHGGIDHALEYVLLGHRRLEVLDERVSLGHIVLAEVIYHQVQSGLGDHINKRGQDLEH